MEKDIYVNKYFEDLDINDKFVNLTRGILACSDDRQFDYGFMCYKPKLLIPNNQDSARMRE